MYVSLTMRYMEVNVDMLLVISGMQPVFGHSLLFLLPLLILLLVMVMLLFLLLLLLVLLLVLLIWLLLLFLNLLLLLLSIVLLLLRLLMLVIRQVMVSRSSLDMYVLIWVVSRICRCRIEVVVQERV